MRTGLAALPGRRSTALAAAGPAQGKSRRSRSPSPSPARVPAGCRRSPGEVCSRTTNRQIPWQAETLARPEYSSRSGRSGHVLTSADPGVGQPSGLRVVHLVRHGAGRPPPRQGRAHIDGGAARLTEARVSASSAGSGKVKSYTPSTRERCGRSPASANTFSISAFSVSVSALKARNPRPRASEIRCSSNSVPTPRCCTSSATVKATSADGEPALLRVTADEHGGDAHGEHVEPGIPGARPAVRARGVGVVLTLSQRAVRVTPWWSW